MTDLRDRIEATVAAAEAEGSKVISVEAIRAALDGEGVPQAHVMAIPLLPCPLCQSTHVGLCEPCPYCDEGMVTHE